MPPSKVEEDGYYVKYRAPEQVVVVCASKEHLDAIITIQTQMGPNVVLGLEDFFLRGDHPDIFRQTGQDGRGR